MSIETQLTSIYSTLFFGQSTIAPQRSQDDLDSDYEAFRKEYEAKNGSWPGATTAVQSAWTSYILGDDPNGMHALGAAISQKAFYESASAGIEIVFETFEALNSVINRLQEAYTYANAMAQVEYKAVGAYNDRAASLTIITEDADDSNVQIYNNTRNSTIETLKANRQVSTDTADQWMTFSNALNDSQETQTSQLNKLIEQMGELMDTIFSY